MKYLVVLSVLCFVFALAVLFGDDVTLPDPLVPGSAVLIGKR